MNSNQKKSIKYIIEHCGNLANNETLLIICDNSTDDIAENFKEIALVITNDVKKVMIPIAKAHGEEPPQSIAEDMLKYDLIISLCKFSLAHTKARMNSSKRARFLSLPLYTPELLEDPAITVDYKSQYKTAVKITKMLTEGRAVSIYTENGTNITLDINDRHGNCCPGFVQNPGDLGSPPDIEVNVSPIETNSNGKIIVDGSITCPEIGLLSNPVIIEVKNGLIESFQSDNDEYVKILEKMFFEGDSKKRFLAECGIGLNYLAKLTGIMLTDEGSLGCVHFGFGSNYTVGGKNKVDFHLDFVFKNASLKIDDQQILRNGDLLI